MDETMKELEQLAVSEDTKQMVREMIARKNKADQLQIRSRIVSGINLIVAIVVLYWLFKLSAVSSTSVLDALFYLGNSTASLLFVLIAVSFFIYGGTIMKAYKKEQQSYEDLRLEAVDKLRTQWDATEESRVRDQLSLLLDRKGINIRHIS